MQFFQPATFAAIGTEIVVAYSATVTFEARHGRLAKASVTEHFSGAQRIAVDFEVARKEV